MKIERYGSGPYYIAPASSAAKLLRIFNENSLIHIEIDFDDVEHDEILKETKLIVDILNRDK